MIGAIILAGGAGLRLSALGKPKQFAEIRGKPLIGYALAAFEQCPDIDKIAVVAHEDWRASIPAIGKFHAFAKPGRTRQHSVFSGLLAMRDVLSDNDLVIVHDAARPLVTALDISECLRAVGGYDGATPAVRLKEAAYQSSDGTTIKSLLNRDELFAGQTPEAYRYGKYLMAHDNVDLAAIRGSSELAFKAGMAIRLFPGNPLNFKVTLAEDLDYLDFLLERGK
ncbi:MAG: 2-C-methyl-D-erythritol 4-phosphate cytidylyltransferase [Clostridiales Family XIII bacterium]|jgi:2-C-methyl-D-erythritol 4-phosphate cytidylyltransferase|nr:2-C-methyl-D-erythritol 4-phosphate cytidylyltransferase [Clostridiales Family XIII bacterium]